MSLAVLRRAFVMGLTVLGTATMGDARAADDIDPVQATLVSQTPFVRPGATAWLGLALHHAPHWHTYWRNPGDSGLPTRVHFTLPDGYTVDDIAWPAPSRFDVDGLYNFGYDGDIVLPIALHVPAAAAVGTTATIRAEVSWLMCREQCLPGKATLQASLPLREQAGVAEAATAARFSRAHASLPHDAAWQAQARRQGEAIVVTLQGKNLPSLQGLDAFVVERKVIDYARPQFAVTGEGLQIRFARSDYFTTLPPSLNLVLVQTVGEAHRAWQVSAPFTMP